MLKFLRLAVLSAALPLAACVPTTPPDWLARPADPAVGVRAPRYSAVTAGVQRYDVVDPKDWRELNRQVTPEAGQGGMEGMDHSKMPGMNMPGMGGKRDTGGR
jgi:hypothetical protein